MRGPALAVLLLLLAGCSGAPAPPPADLVEETRRSSDPGEAGQAIEAPGCYGKLVLGILPSSMVQPLVPDRYPAGGYLTDDVASVGLAALDCPRVHLQGNATAPLRLAWLVVQLTSLDYYLVELFVDGPADDPVLAALHAHGLEPRPASITLEDRAFRIASVDGITYDAVVPMAAPQRHEPLGLTHQDGVVHDDAAGVAHHATLGWETGTPVADITAATVTAQGGALAVFAERNGVPFTGQGQSVATDLGLTLADDTAA